MSNAVIITAHGRYASGVKSGIDLIVGEMPNLRVVDFIEGDTFEVIDESLKSAFKELEDYENIVFLTDLKGGTPFNRSVLLFSDRENVRVLSGLNFGLLYQALVSETNDINEYVKEILTSGRDSIDLFEVREKEEEDLEDGI